MCGIIHCKSLDGKKACKSVLKRYTTQKNRGTQGFGFIEILNDVIVGIKRAETEKEILEMLAKSEAPEIMFHHRFPTSTPNFVESTHPIFVSHESLLYNYYVVHNGVISNDEDLKKKHNEKGFVYTTDTQKQYLTRGETYNYDVEFNDSEALAIDFALSVENKTKMESRGSIALVALQVEKSTNKVVALFWGHNDGNPLKLENYKGFFALSSESGKAINEDILYKMDYPSLEISEEEKDIGIYWGRASNSTTTTYGFKPTSNLALPYKSNVGKKEEEEEEVDTDALKQRQIEEDDYILDLEVEIEHWQGERDRAIAKDDYDRVAECEQEIATLKLDLSYQIAHCLD